MDLFGEGEKDLPNPKEALLGVGFTGGGEFYSFPN